MPAHDSSAGHAGEPGGQRAVVVALGTDGDAVENFDVKVDHASPIFGDEVGVSVTDTHIARVLVMLPRCGKP